MILYDFDYEPARSLPEALALLARLGPGARIMGGGTDLLPNMRLDLTRPTTIVGLRGIKPEPPRVTPEGGLRIDGLMTLADIARSELIASKLPMLAESARVVGSHQVREMGTLAGNLCQETRCLQLNQKHDFQFKAPCYKRGGECCYPFPSNRPGTCWSVYMSDVAPALMALEAEVETERAAGGRRLAVETMFTGDGMRPIRLDAGEIIRAVITPPVPSHFGWAYHKLSRRGGFEYGAAVIAVALSLESGRLACADARIVIGAIRERPVRAREAERALIGQPFDDTLVAAAVAATVDEAKPLPHHGFTRSYLIDTLRVHLRRAFVRAVERARAQSPGDEEAGHVGR
ncbi:MAG: FAD binding domain-containing protein [Xanthobacteraceae bacterium]